MSIILPDNLPATQTLSDEGCSVIRKSRMDKGAFGFLKIGLLNLMPDKITTETQFARLLGSNLYPIEMRLFRLKSHTAKCCSSAHLDVFYKPFDKNYARDLDALIITGAPVEHPDFSEVPYWQSLQGAMDIAACHVPETLGVCWGAMALAYHHHGVGTVMRSSKAFGCIDHTVTEPKCPLVFGIEKKSKIPVNRWTMIQQAEIDKRAELKTLMTGAVGEPSIIRDRKTNSTYVLNHFEYDDDTLANEYHRDNAKGIPIQTPIDYFVSADTTKIPPNTWRSNARVFYANWLNQIFCRTKHK